uniref:Uncharacterized protein n=1 Tax=Timema bartmani TaxID=61472 RepID=A0A7R9I8E1_9NEOP|nr:unnamed protein product [Timema bartmani]
MAARASRVWPTAKWDEFRLDLSSPPSPPRCANRARADLWTSADAEWPCVCALVACFLLVHIVSYDPLKSLPRWMNKMCVQCQPQKKEGSDEYYTFSFFEDVIRIQAVNDMVYKIRETVHALIADILKYLQRKVESKEDVTSMAMAIDSLLDKYTVGIFVDTSSVVASVVQKIRQAVMSKRLQRSIPLMHYGAYSTTATDTLTVTLGIRPFDLWKSYRNLWTFDKNVMCDKFAAKKPTVVMYDEQFSFYGQVIQDFDKIDTYYDVRCVRLLGSFIARFNSLLKRSPKKKPSLGHWAVTINFLQC